MAYYGFGIAGFLLIYGIITAMKPKENLKLKPGQTMEDAVKTQKQTVFICVGSGLLAILRMICAIVEGQL